MSEPLIRVTGLRKSFQTGDGTIEVLRGLDFEIQPGECVAIVGSSGVGKSTLLHILGALDHPTSGTVGRPTTRPALRGWTTPTGWVF